MEKHCSFYSELNSTGTDNVMRKSPSKNVLVPFITSAYKQTYESKRVKHAKKQFLIRNDQSPPVERKHLPEFCAWLNRQHTFKVTTKGKNHPIYKNA